MQRCDADLDDSRVDQCRAFVDQGHKPENNAKKTSPVIQADRQTDRQTVII